MSSSHFTHAVEPARPDERPAALRLFFQHAGAERDDRVERTLALIERGELDGDSLLVCRRGGEVVGAIVALVQPGATGMLWPPQVCAGGDTATVEDWLLYHAGEWLRRRGCKFAQALLAPGETAAPVLERNGVRRITTLLFLRRDGTAFDAAETGRLTYQTYAPGNAELFHATLLASYADSLDCPELNHVRAADEIIAGYHGAGGRDTDRWWLALDDGRPVGVLILMDSPVAGAWELSYLGLVPEARGRGLGRAMTRKALADAGRAGAAGVTLTMDRRNVPAWRLYTGLGFAEYDRREVYLTVYATPQNAH